MRGTETREIGTDEGPSFAVEITQIDDPHRISLETHPVYNASTASYVGDQDSLVECRICLQTDKVSNLVQPCSCHGTLSYCHYSCLESWVKESRKLKCEICGNSYTTEIKEQLREVVTRAEQIDQERRRVLSLGAQLEAIAGAHQDEGTLHTPRCRLLIFIFLFVAFAFVALRIQSSNAFPNWLGSLLEILAVVIPICFIVKLLFAIQQYRNEQNLNN